ncbi:unnamed protein product [Euphydryas editha]|uniref:Uncharacterized protein n=1 Tax=Euphydryas editha TaxID=104508 RepID=A0AAU9UK45_EUPED|nr:unnamed protein product [Euphydryas editha]
MVRRVLPRHAAVSPVLTVEPRRRKFHRSITLTAPLPHPPDQKVTSLCAVCCVLVHGAARAAAPRRRVARAHRGAAPPQVPPQHHAHGAAAAPARPEGDLAVCCVSCAGIWCGACCRATPPCRPCSPWSRAAASSTAASRSRRRCRTRPTRR